MRKSVSGILLLALAACPEPPAPPKPPPPPPPAVAAPPQKAPPPADAGQAKSVEVRAKFTALMENNGELNKAIKEDVEKKRPEAAIKEKLAKIRKNAEAARALDYLKDEDKRQEFDSYFEVFIDIRMKNFLESEWTEATGDALYEKLQSSCRTCHEPYRD